MVEVSEQTVPVTQEGLGDFDHRLEAALVHLPHPPANEVAAIIDELERPVLFEQVLQMPCL